MGLVKSTVELINLSDKYLAQAGHLKPEQVRKMAVQVMVDSGAGKSLLSFKHYTSVLVIPSGL